MSFLVPLLAAASDRRDERVSAVDGVPSARSRVPNGAKPRAREQARRKIEEAYGAPPARAASKVKSLVAGGSGGPEGAGGGSTDRLPPMGASISCTASCPAYLEQARALGDVAGCGRSTATTRFRRAQRAASFPWWPGEQRRRNPGGLSVGGSGRDLRGSGPGSGDSAPCGRMSWSREATGLSTGSWGARLLSSPGAENGAQSAVCGRARRRSGSDRADRGTVVGPPLTGPISRLLPRRLRTLRVLHPSSTIGPRVSGVGWPVPDDPCCCPWLPHYFWRASQLTDLDEELPATGPRSCWQASTGAARASGSGCLPDRNEADDPRALSERRGGSGGWRRI